MKKITLVTLSSLFVTTLLSANIAQAANAEQARPGHGGPERGAPARGRDPEARLQRQFERLDSSGDAELSYEEFTAKLESRVSRTFARKDSDDDGLLSFEEATTNRRGERPDLSGIAQDIVDCVADLASEEGSLIIVPDVERFASPETKFDEVDSNDDDFIDTDEALAAAALKAENAFSQMDADEDGFVSFEEFSTGKAQQKATRAAIKECIETIDSEEIL